MPAPAKPLFRLEAIRPKLLSFTLPPSSDSVRAKLAGWAKLLASDSGKKKKETELRDEFLFDVFRDLLGYTTASQHADAYTFKKEQFVQVDGTFADAGFGRFGGSAETFVSVLEGKGPNDKLDQPYGGRKRSAFEQALLYAYNLRVDWFLVTNLKETRLYCKRADQFTYERFETEQLAADENELKRFVFLLGAERVVSPSGKNHLDDLLAESKRIGRELTNDFYREYRQLRESSFDALRQHNPDRHPAELLAATQKMLDRVLFIAFAEDRELLPRDSIKNAYEHDDAYHDRPVWDNFKVLFQWVDKGNARRNVSPYNGGLFKPDTYLESLTVPDDVCLGFKKLAEYEYGNDPDADARLIDVEILGHIFEQSISDLEEMQNMLAGLVKETKSKEQKKTTRKETGAFYTPPFITCYLVAETLGPVVAARFEEVRRAHEETAAKPIKKVLADPASFDADDLTKPRKAALVKFWEAWLEALEQVRIVDPACGSGAFLLEAFDQMFAHYQKAQGFLSDLQGKTLFDIRKTILEHNLFGVDLNAAAVEIAQLSCWIKTAEIGKQLTSLDHNIRQGNSVVADLAVHPKAFDWQAAFPEVFAAGGFDVVVGNPPYVRQEWIKEYKPHWEERFKSYHSTADLFTYFYELGFQLLRPDGRLGFITSGGWVRGNYGEGLRGYLARNTGLESMIDFGEYQPFEDAEMIRPTITVIAKRSPGRPMRLFKWLTSAKPPENLSDVIRSAPLMQTDHLGKETWELEPDDVIKLRKKLAAKGQPLGVVCEGQMFRGVTTGLNEAFVIDGKTKIELDKDGRSGAIIKPFLQGTNLRPWHTDKSGEWLIFARRGIEIDNYPAVLEHLTKFRKALEPKPADWPDNKHWTGRKGGPYKWYELQDATDYWPAFEKPKIVWPDITNCPRFAYDSARLFLGDTGMMVPSEDLYLLGVLSSWASWFFISKTAQPLRLRSDRWQYRLKKQYLENVPIPDAQFPDRQAIAALAVRCNTFGTQRYQLEESVRHRLTEVFGLDSQGQPLGKLNEKAQDWWEQSVNELGDALKQSFKLKRSPFTNPKTADEWEPYLTSKKTDVESLRRRLADAEAEINDRVYKLFELTLDEIKLLQREVEH